MPTLDELLISGRIIKTHNQMGYSFLEMNVYSLEFIEYATHAQAPVLDMGAAFGVTVLPILKQGGTVIANDLAIEHLEILQNNTPLQQRERLQICPGKIPGEVNFGADTLAAIHSCFVFHFLTGDEVAQAVALMYRWLQPGGKVFIITRSPYQKSLEKFIPIYEARKRSGDFWPGYIEDVSAYIQADMMRNVPTKISVVDAEILKNIFQREGFHIEKAEEFDVGDGVPDHNKLDGRETVGLIARKPV